MTLIVKADVEHELQLTLPAGYTESIISEIADAAENLLKLKTNRTTFTNSIYSSM